MKDAFRFDSEKMSRSSLSLLAQVSGTNPKQWPGITRALFSNTQDVLVGTLFYALNEALDDAPNASAYLTNHPILADWLESALAESCAKQVTSVNPPLFMEYCVRDATGSDSDLTYTDDITLQEIPYVLKDFLEGASCLVFQPYKLELEGFLMTLCSDLNAIYSSANLTKTLCNALNIDCYI